MQLSFGEPLFRSKINKKMLKCSNYIEPVIGLNINNKPYFKYNVK